ncbi:Nucleoside diphosphate kinase 7 [Apophysomyces sp. BC1034]|nr:Nucleoside diphosphate kinase 7 [Apophysomyces sp. BC1015]KAG0177666.1 Nucleoside diphosphate kinase 7 [Apophysomyces sp. BC1021]KAG0188254.1 Nucleoside diphosphate kinase 7 [Apophysomyces sp. BC1034]
MSQQEDRTVGIIRPDAFEYKDRLMQLIRQADLKVVLEKEMQLSEEQIIALGEGTLTEWLTSQPVYAFILEGPDAIQRWRDVLDPQDPDRVPTSAQALYGTDLLRSVYHGSQSEEGAKHEVAWLQALMSDDLSPTSVCKSTPGTKPLTKQSKVKTTGSATKKTTTKPASKTAAPKSSTMRPAQSAKQSVQSVRTTTTRKPAPTPAGTKKSPPAIHSSTGGMSKTRTTRTAAGSEMGAERSGVTKSRRSSNVTPKTTTGAKESTLPPSRISNRNDTTTVRRGNVAAPATTKKLSSTGGISKNTPPKSVLTGRTRKYSKVRKDVAEEEKKKEGEIKPKVEEAEVHMEHPKMEPGDSCETLSDIEPWNHKETDSEHDAEVAAATAAVCQAIAERPSSARASFSPNSVASLPRPETPEVDQLRQRFETMAHITPGCEKRKSTISPEIATRIKDLKPKDPAGTRVKSMVEFFMDENLHKWEF